MLEVGTSSFGAELTAKTFLIRSVSQGSRRSHEELTAEVTAPCRFDLYRFMSMCSPCSSLLAFFNKRSNRSEGSSSVDKQFSSSPSFLSSPNMSSGKKAEAPNASSSLPLLHVYCCCMSVCTGSNNKNLFVVLPLLNHKKLCQFH